MHVECEHFEERNSKIHNGMLLLAKVERRLGTWVEGGVQVDYVILEYVGNPNVQEARKYQRE